MGSLSRRSIRRQCQSTAAEAEARLRRLLGDTMRATTPPTLSHVTGTLNTLESILGSRTIWATRSTRVRGDAEELRAGEELAERVARRMLENERRSLARDVLSEFVSVFSQERISEKAPVFLACFTPRIDGIHWDRYGADAGVAVTFNITTPREPDQEVELALVPVLYDVDSVEQLLSTAFAKAFALAEVAQRFHSPGWAQQTLRPLFLRIAATIAIQTKRRNWIDENEWRLVAVPGPKHQDRIKPLPVEHVAVPLNPGGVPDVQEIILSPGHPAPGEAIDRLGQFLTANGYPAIAIRCA